jgi:glycosyltransferase involved in cell wall biosynthesis
MRIAFFNPHSDPLADLGEPDAGGQCVYEAKVAQAFAAAGHEVRAFTRHDGVKPREQLIAPGASVHRYPMGPEGFLRKEDMGPYLVEFTDRVLTDQRQWLEGADVFHGHYWDGGGTALMASLGLGKPLVFTAHSLGILKRDRVADPTPDGREYRYGVRIPAETRLLRAADRVIMLSDLERQAQVGRYGISPDHLRIVPGGVDIERFTPHAGRQALKAELDVTTDFMVFTIGRVDPRKGFVELIEAIPRVVTRLAEHGKTVTFFVPHGSATDSASGPVEANGYRRMMEAKAAQLGVTAHIRWFARLSDEAVADHYAAADLFVCPSPYEPFGLVVVEAFAAGTPAVATCNGGPVEIVTPGEDGYLAEPSRPDEFAARILDVLLAEPASRERLGANALAKAQERYAWPAVASQLVAVYAEIVPGARPGEQA